MDFVFFIMAAPFVIGLFVALVKIDEKSKAKNGCRKYYPPSRHSLQRAGITPKDKEYYRWERKLRKQEQKRKFWKEKKKEWERAGKGPWPYKGYYGT